MQYSKLLARDGPRKEDEYGEGRGRLGRGNDEFGLTKEIEDRLNEFVDRRRRKGRRDVETNRDTNMQEGMM